MKYSGPRMHMDIVIIIFGWFRILKVIFIPLSEFLVLYELPFSF